MESARDSSGAGGFVFCALIDMDQGQPPAMAFFKTISNSGRRLGASWTVNRLIRKGYRP
jgi:hypothetical protein